MFKFTIRELLLVTAIVGLATGWWVDRFQLAARAARADQFKKLSALLAENLRDQNNKLLTLEVHINGEELTYGRSMIPAAAPPGSIWDPAPPPINPTPTSATHLQAP